jgi:hypothetical protein
MEEPRTSNGLAGTFVPIPTLPELSDVPIPPVPLGTYNAWENELRLAISKINKTI